MRMYRNSECNGDGDGDGDSDGEDERGERALARKRKRRVGQGGWDVRFIHAWWLAWVTGNGRVMPALSADKMWAPFRCRRA